MKFSVLIVVAILLLVKPHLGFFNFQSQIIRQKSHPSFKKEKILRFSNQKELKSISYFCNELLRSRKTFTPFLCFIPHTFLLKVLLAHNMYGLRKTVMCKKRQHFLPLTGVREPYWMATPHK